jgi:hypothetical protein
MQEKEMQQVKVYINDKGFVCIEQDDYGGENPVIFLDPNQIDILIKWLIEAKDELNKDII